VCLLVQNGLRTLLGGGALGGGGAPTGLIAPGATHPRYATGLMSKAYELKKIEKQPLMNINVLQDENCQNQ
jgi:hypothetical protein